MLFKLSFKNMKKSIKDYAIYFLTLVLGVAIFYMFNSLDSQQAMLTVSNSQRQIITLMIEMLGYVSVFVAIILGILIIYANSFLVNRRKKEFGIYMTLGMGKRQISKIILLETVFVGIISLIVGIVVGVFASQFMSVLVAKMFEADMSEFQFTFSKDSCIKTGIYFAIMYVLVMIFNTMSVSRYKLINLLNATKKNEKVKIKNPILSVLVFIIGTVILGYAYSLVTVKSDTLDSAEKLLLPIIMGIVSTVLIFWSLSGFTLGFIQKMKGIYYKGTNMFVLRQLNNKINTTVISMSVICLMLFMTITILSS
ncbi:MAG: FtsX-like permease family protein, partial [Clostridia bacterium]|nr:FtsX-like permease family protein [Clostridia bacterium]